MCLQFIIISKNQTAEKKIYNGSHLGYILYMHIYTNMKDMNDEYKR